MGRLRFTAPIEIRDGNPYILVSPERATTLAAGWRKPLPVTVQINGQPTTPWHINMMPAGDGSFYLYLHGDVRKASKTKVGDVVNATVAFDEAYHSGPMHPMPAVFTAGLAADPIAKANWEALIPSRQKEMLRYFSYLKSDAALQRNIQKAMQILGGESGRFMARSWKDGS